MVQQEHDVHAVQGCGRVGRAYTAQSNETSTQASPSAGRSPVPREGAAGLRVCRRQYSRPSMTSSGTPRDEKRPDLPLDRHFGPGPQCGAGSGLA